MKARIFDGKIIEILTPIDGFSIEDCFHPSVLAQCFNVAATAQVGDDYVPLPVQLFDPNASTEPPTPTPLDVPPSN